MTDSAAGGTILKRAVTQNNALSRAGFSERLFAWLFKGLVYPQIWEDPEVDMAALAIKPGHRIVTIASGGCNALSYLTADPARIEAVDLNEAHVAFNRLKLAALKHLPDYQAFYRFYGKAHDKTNLAAYKRFIRPHLDSESRAYWEKRKWNGRQRISIFWRKSLSPRPARRLHRHGASRGAALWYRSARHLEGAHDGRTAQLLRHGSGAAF
jgi:S-adenosylmethionine-diacylglycerol 3-amino-3-carboxypropyl transferase